MLRRKREVFSPTDGVLAVCVQTDRAHDRGADFSDPGWLDEAMRLPYRRLRVSARDAEMAGAAGCELTVKAEVRKAPGLATDQCVTLGGRVFDLTRVEDRGPTCWLWLSEVATDGTCTLLPRRTARDAHGIPSKTGEDGTEVWCRRASPSATRALADGIDALRPCVTLRLRASDYAGEPALRRDGVTYTVTSAHVAGMWVDLACERKVADR